MMGAVNLKIDASWVEELTKMRVQFFSAPTVFGLIHGSSFNQGVTRFYDFKFQRAFLYSHCVEPIVQEIKCRSLIFVIE